MPTSRTLGNSPIIAPVLRQHLAELTALWEQRGAWTRDRDLTAADIARVDRRLMAHVDAILLHGDAILPVLEPLLEQGEPSAVFVATYLLVLLSSSESQRILTETLRRAKPEALAGLREGLCQGPIEGVLPVLRELEQSADGPQCLMATEVLAVHDRLESRMVRWRTFLAAPETPLREAAWRIAAYCEM